MSDDKVRIGIEDENGRVRTKEMDPVIARQLGMMIIAMADEKEGIEPHYLSVRRRWRPWGTRDRTNIFVGYMVGSSLVWANSDWHPWNWVFLGVQAVVAVAGSAYQFRRDREDEKTEKKRTGRPVWE